MSDDSDDFRRAPQPDPQIQDLLDEFDARDVPDTQDLPVERARELHTNVFVPSEEQPEPVGNVAEMTICGPGGEIPIRVYTPDDEGPFPALVYFHGGGWVVGSLDTYDSIARALTNRAEAAVVLVGYRLGPEHPFPAAVEDAIAATHWVSDNATGIGADPDRIAVGGESAGGTLATVVALEARDREDLSLVHQSLVYPVTDLVSFDTRSYEQNAEGFWLERDTMEWYRKRYLRGEIDRRNVYTSPRLARDLSDLPPATVITGGYDPLRDDGFAYAEQLEADGVPVEHTNYEGMTHDFFNMHLLDDPFPDIERAEEGFDEVAAGLRNAFDG